MPRDSVRSSPSENRRFGIVRSQQRPKRPGKADSQESMVWERVFLEQDRVMAVGPISRPMDWEPKSARREEPSARGRPSVSASAARWDAGRSRFRGRGIRPVRGWLSIGRGASRTRIESCPGHRLRRGDRIVSVLAARHSWPFAIARPAPRHWLFRGRGGGDLRGKSSGRIATGGVPRVPPRR